MCFNIPNLINYETALHNKLRRKIHLEIVEFAFVRRLDVEVIPKVESQQVADGSWKQVCDDKNLSLVKDSHSSFGSSTGSLKKVLLENFSLNET